METINLTLIYNQNYNTILSYCIGKLKNIEICEEITNDVFCKFNRLVEECKFDSTKCAIKTYLFTICNSAIIDYLRANKHSNRVVNMESYVDDNGNEFFSVSEKSLNAEDRLIDNEFNQKIEAAFNSLKPQARKVAELFFLQDKKYTEIATICNISLSNVKVTILRAREVLQVELARVKKIYYS